MGRIIIITGLVRSGKTTALKEWIESKKDVNGILTPDVDDQRVFMHYPERKIIPMLSETNTPGAIKVGKYNFSGESFEKVNELLKRDIEDRSCSWLVFDEIGILELDGKGLFPAFDYMLKRIEEMDKTVLIVVRGRLLGRMIKQFGLNDVRVILKTGLVNLE